MEASFTGSKLAAEKGELVYYVGGTDAALREARPILKASSKEIIAIGAVGQASAIKVATNMVTAASVQAAAEALALVKALGLPLEKFIEAMRANPRPLEYLNSEQPLVNLLQQLSKRTKNRQIHVQTPGFSVTLERRA